MPVCALISPVALLLLALTGFSALAARWWVFALITHFRPQLAAAAVLVAGLAIACGDVLALAAALGAVLVNGAPLLPYLRPQSADPAKSGPQLTVMAFNLLDNATNPRWLKRLIERVQPDVLVLTELSRSHGRLLDTIGPFFRHRYADRPQSHRDIAVLSRWPITAATTDRSASAMFPVSSLDLDHAEIGAIRLIALHPPVPFFGLARQQKEHVTAAARHVREAGGRPIIVAGDFNLTPWAPLFIWLMRETGLKDSACARVLTATWLFRFPLFGLPIDQILVSPTIDVLQSEVHGFIGSDHRPISARLRFPRAAQ